MQEREQENTMIFNVRSYTNKFQLILCFNIDLKEHKDSAMQGTVITEAPLAKFSFRHIGGAKSVSLFLMYITRHKLYITNHRSYIHRDSRIIVVNRYASLSISHTSIPCGSITKQYITCMLGIHTNIFASDACLCNQGSAHGGRRWAAVPST